MPESLSQLGWIDLSLLGVLAVSVLIGLWRGFTFEIISLLGWLLAYVMANAFAATLAPWLPFGGAPGGPLRRGISYGLVFLLVLLACAILARMMRALIRVTPLSVVDRLLGGAFGAMRALLLMLAAATLVALSPLARAESWRSSHGALWLGQALEGLRPVLPESLSRQFQA